MVVLVRDVTGAEGRSNDVLFVPAARAPASVAALDTSPGTVVFFGGDVQDYPEEMCQVSESRPYVAWSLVASARSLARQFPLSHVLVVRAARHEGRGLTCYDNFVPSSGAGVPDHTATHGALRHLQRLLQNVTERLKSMPMDDLVEALTDTSLAEEMDVDGTDKPDASEGVEASEQRNGSPKHRCHSRPSSSCEPDGRAPVEELVWWRDSLQLDRGRMTLVGFSKGCVVLNQLVYEFHYTKTLTPGDEDTARFMNGIESMYWLDGGHAGGKNTWLTARSILETLTRLDVNIYVHVSPYQVNDDRRPWIGREEKVFTSLLTKLGAKIRRYLHSQPNPGATPSVFTHFAVLTDFKRVQDERRD